ncbi:Monocarboxylate transporter 14 [Pseudolycoriella hygida]|uniref:Monocarboxylate transporter 14 n=1 Tax=Pseudolycoriella hygida TaxID=35572 RepID=A0A9Q0S6S6_9DIPT|nr:Monocarboxylate transporter 14 [Pseudolycoriella hygida]
MGFGMIYTSSIISVGYYFEKYRALSTGIALCGSSIGGLCLSPLFAYLVAEKGWEFTMKMQSCFILICLFSCLTYRPLKPTATVPLTEEIINEIDNLTSPSRMDFVELYKTDSLISIDLVNDSSEESRHFPQISIISSRFLPTPTIKTDKKTCCSWLRKFCLKKAQPGKNLGKLISTGPLDRKDIFYSASVLQIPEYKNIMKENTGDSRRKISYHLSMMLDPETVQLSKRFLSPRMQVVDEDTLRCFGIPHMIQKALRNLFDVSLMKSFVFCTLSAACLCYALAWITPYVYLPKRGEMNKIQEKYTRWFISSMSIGNAIGRISAGVLATFCQCLNPFYMVGIANVAAGTITVISALIGTSDVNVQFIYCIVVGFCIAFFSVLRPVMFVRVLGLGKLTNAFGLSAAMLGVGLLTGTPIASILYERTETFTWTFISCGIFFIFSGTLVILAFRIYLWQERKN